MFPMITGRMDNLKVGFVRRAAQGEMPDVIKMIFLPQPSATNPTSPFLFFQKLAFLFCCKRVNLD